MSGDARLCSRTNSTSFCRSFFDSPQPAGRKITAGFTYLQRIGKAATYDVWFPEDLRQELDARLARGQQIGAEHFASQWAAVRQFELLHESGNHKIYDLDPELLQRAMLDLSRSMRAGGYRITVATLGRYEETSSGDELEILDHHLQEGIAQMIHMLYLEEESAKANAENDAHLYTSQWDYCQDLPHIGMVLGAGDVFQRYSDNTEEYILPKRRKKGEKKGGTGTISPAAKRHKLARQFFDILNKLPQNHIVHDTAVGLQLPELNGENQWNYIADSEETLLSFNRVLSNIFDKFDGVNLARLNGDENARDEIKASTLHMRGYGDRMNESSEGFYRRASLALN
ncbi:MAG: hypothetical protein WC521_03175 [Bdellovibrionales bacterium]